MHSRLQPDVQHGVTLCAARLVGHLLGHEGPGSLLSLLKARGWADALCAGEVRRAVACC